MKIYFFYYWMWYHCHLFSLFVCFLRKIRTIQNIAKYAYNLFIDRIFKKISTSLTTSDITYDICMGYRLLLFDQLLLLLLLLLLFLVMFLFLFYFHYINHLSGFQGSFVASNWPLVQLYGTQCCNSLQITTSTTTF